MPIIFIDDDQHLPSPSCALVPCSGNKQIFQIARQSGGRDRDQSLRNRRASGHSAASRIAGGRVARRFGKLADGERLGQEADIIDANRLAQLFSA